MPALYAAPELHHLAAGADLHDIADGLHLPADLGEDLRESDVSAQGHQAIWHTLTATGAVMDRPANDEMVEGFRDGYDLTAPEPSANRSASYRHGFMCGRIDKGQVSSPGAQRLRVMADEAMEADGTLS